MWVNVCIDVHGGNETLHIKGVKQIDHTVQSWDYKGYSALRLILDNGQRVTFARNLASFWLC